MTEPNQQQAAGKPQPPQQTRGAGSGENAVATRGRNYNESPDKNLDFAEGKKADDYKPGAYEPGPEFPEGDPAAGKLDYRTQNEAADPNLNIPMRDRRAYLIDQAEKNQAANDELNAIQVKQHERLQRASNLIHDPDYQRDISVEQAKIQLERHDPDKKLERIKGEMEARARRDKAAAAALEGKK